MFRLVVLLFIAYRCYGVSVIPEEAYSGLLSHLLNAEEIKEITSNIENDIHEPATRLVTLEENMASPWPELHIHTDERSLKMRLKPSANLVTPKTKVVIMDEEGEAERFIHPDLVGAFYHGDIEGVQDGSVALGKTDSGWMGIVNMEDGRYHLQQVPQSTSNKYLLIKHLHRDQNVEVPFVPPRETRAENSEFFELEVGAYADESMYKFAKEKFPATDPETVVQNMVLLLLNEVHHIYSKPGLDHKIHIVVVQITIMKNQPADLPFSPNIEKYLGTFCKWDSKTKNIRGRQYDLGLLMTGTDMYAQGQYGEVMSGVMGVAPLNGACAHGFHQSCFVGEGRKMQAGAIMTHEIGHTLGMKHDSDGNACPANTYIMGAGFGSHTQRIFSTCSNNYLNKFITKLDEFGLNCLRKIQAELIFDHSEEELLPGERVPPGTQCLLEKGEGYVEAYAHAWFCKILQCAKKEFVKNGKVTDFKEKVYTTNSPLPGSPCGTTKVCWNRLCQEKTKVLKEINNYKKTRPTSAPKALSADKLCSKYTENTYPIAATYTNLHVDASATCPSLICFRDKHNFKDYKIVHLMGAPEGTPCASGKTCKDYMCE